MLVQFFDRLSAAQPDANRSLRKTLRIEMEIGPWAPGVGTVVVLSVPYWNIEKDLFSNPSRTMSVVLPSVHFWFSWINLSLKLRLIRPRPKRELVTPPMFEF